MQEMNRCVAFAILLVVIFGCGHQQLKHESDLAKKYPHGLIGDDFGVLGTSDLAVNACQATPAAFSPKEMSSYQYWQCFRTQDARVSCDSAGANRAIFGVDVEAANAKHRYAGPRVDSAANCRWFLNEWNRVTAGQRYVCLSGQFDRMDLEGSNKGEEMSWIVDRFKSPAGCVSQFYGGCDLEYQMKHGCANSDNMLE